MLQHVTVPRGPVNLAADLHLPDHADGRAPLPAVVLSTPGSSVKEQIGANYASRLAARGIAALVLDPAHQGRSEGEPRDLEDPYRRGEDISYAIDLLTKTPAVDPRRIGVLGICAGGGKPCTPPAPTTASKRSARSSPSTSAPRSALSPPTARPRHSTTSPMPVRKRSVRRRRTA
nr:alpha/beta hydrolase [Actinospica acidiphila]